MKKLILALLLFASVAAQSQLTVELGATKTDLKQAALRLGITYLRSLDSLFGDRELFLPGKRSFFMVTPELDIQTGTEDAFSSINLKATGLLNFFKTHEVSGLIAPDYSRTFHSFPISLGIETNNSFNNTNGILEVGWVPFYQSYSRASPDWVKKTSFGIFAQAGYKFNADSSGVGGDEFEALEQDDRGIFRARGTASVNTDKLLKLQGLNIGLVGTADGWYDFINSEVYHKLEGRVRVFLTDITYFDFIFSKGSGAPLFNEAEQYGVGVTLKL